MLLLPSKIVRFRPQDRSRSRLPLPAVPSQRVAQLSEGTRAFDSAQAFPRNRWEQLETFRPRVLVGSAADLHCVANLAQRHVLDLSSVDHALFAVTRWGSQPVSDVSRVVLWQAFGVPVYELLVNARGALLASECEAHEGWHIERRARFSLRNGELILDSANRLGRPTGLKGSVETELCPCGRPGMRLMNIEPMVALMRVPRELAAATA